LGIEKVEGAKIRGTGRAGGGKGGAHARRKGIGSRAEDRGNKGRTKDKLLELFGREKGIASWGTIREEVGARAGAEGREVIGIEVVKILNSKSGVGNRGRHASDGRSGEEETFGDIVKGRGRGGDANRLRES
jgi:hypothetical protein